MTLHTFDSHTDYNSLDQAAKTAQVALLDYFSLNDIDPSDIADYAIGTDDQADQAVKEYVLDSLWSFNSKFIAEFLREYQVCDLNDRAVESLQKAQSELCEDANELIKGLIGDHIDSFVGQAIDADGRGHFLAGYDFCENSHDFISANTGTVETYYIYRNN
jgi:hypothetical protein